MVLYFLSYQTDHHLAKTLFDISVFFGLLTLASKYQVFFRHRGLQLFSLATISFVLVASISSLLNDTPWFSEELGRVYHAAGALLLIPLLFVVRVRPRTFYLAISLATIACGIYALIEVWHHSSSGYRVGGSRHRPIVFGDTVLLMGFISVCGSYLPALRSARLTRFLPWIALISGVTVSYLSGSRGGWMFVPFALITAFLLLREYPAIRMAVYALSVVVVLTSVAVFMFEPNKAERMRIAADEVASVVDPGKQINMNSVTIRFRLWGAAWMAFTESPWFGIGIASFRDYLHEISTRKMIPARIAHYQHAHNQFLNVLATNGVFGELALLAMFLVPLWFYGKSIRTAAKEELPLRVSGLLATSGFAVFCLTDSLFFVPESFVFYMVLQVVLMTSVIRAREEITTATGRL